MDILGERYNRVLKTVMAVYIATGEPVGSRTVARFSGLNLSAATIRNLMLDLEERGYLRQPHTSAGRLPTPLGFRYYVDQILAVQELGLAPRNRLPKPSPSRIPNPRRSFARFPGCSPPSRATRP